MAKSRKRRAAASTPAVTINPPTSADLVSVLTQIFATGSGRAQYQQAVGYFGQWLSYQPGNDADVGQAFFDLDRQLADLDDGIVSDLLQPAKPNGRRRKSY